MHRIRPGLVFFMQSIQKKKMAVEKENMEKQKAGRSKGGRPRKPFVRNRHLAVKCTLAEAVLIQAKAKTAGLSVSEFLRGLGLGAKVEPGKKALPPEVLSLAGTLNHAAANLNQIAKKRNGVTDELSPLERAELKIQSEHLKAFVQSIKQYFQ